MKNPKHRPMNRSQSRIDYLDLGGLTAHEVYPGSGREGMLLIPARGGPVGRTGTEEIVPSSPTTSRRI